MHILVWTKSTKIASSRGLVVKAETERSWVQTPTVETTFHAPSIWIKAWKQKLSGN